MARTGTLLRGQWSNVEGRRSALRTALIASAALVLLGGRAAAQRTQLRPYGELRGDAIFGRPDAGQLGAGLQLPLGIYARLGLLGAGGVAWANDEALGSARIDGMMRFLLDPFRESRIGVSAGAGVSVRYDETYGWRPFLLVALDIEGRRVGGVTPAFQVGLGGGTRIGVALRMSPRAYR